MKKVELLAPAGDYESFLGAVHAGADAVYLGGEKFGARAYADNFDTDTLLRVLDEAHLFGKKVYLTANVLTRQEELEELVSFVRRLYAQGLDGAIIQDLGVAAALRKACPGLPLHASTQMSVTAAESVRFLKKLGFTRVVPARELSLDEIRALNMQGEEAASSYADMDAPEASSRQERMEIEAFIHGAMCYSFSGRCLMSSFLGGRSGNRGRCAGTCRLPYNIYSDTGDAMRLEPYPISMKDMCVLPILPELIDAGIDSFKIEGRMKRAEYAAGTTAVYRKYIDRFYEWDRAGRPGSWLVEKQDEEMLRHLYIRADLSTGYYHQYNGKNMVTLHKPGYLGAEDSLLEEIRSRYIDKKPSVRLEGAVVFLPGQEAQLSLWTASESETAGSAAVTVTGDIVQTAQNRPLGEEELRSRLCRTGDTFFEIADMEITADGNGFLPVSAVNELRRRALEEMKENLCAPYRRNRNIPEEPADVTEKTEDRQSLPASAAEEPADVTEKTGNRKSLLAAGNTVKADRYLYICVTSEEQLQAACNVLKEISWLREPGSDEKGGVPGADVPSGRRMPVLILDGQLPHRLAAGELELPHIKTGPDRERPDADGDPGPDQPVVPVMAAMPYVFRDRDRQRLQADLKALRGKIGGYFVRTAEELEFLHENEYYGKVMSDASLYQWNTDSREVFADQCESMTLPLELSREELRRTFGASAQSMVLQVYGHIPMMITQNCIRRTSGKCLHKESGFWSLEDRKGVRFPVRTDCTYCHNIIYNSVPLSLHGYTDDYLYRNAGGILCSFTKESAEETGRILSGYLQDWKICPENGIAPPASFTTGHFKKGAI